MASRKLKPRRSVSPDQDRLQSAVGNTTPNHEGILWESLNQVQTGIRQALESSPDIDAGSLGAAIFQQTHDAILVLQDRHCIACNQNALTLLEASREDILVDWPGPLAEMLFENGESAHNALADAIHPSRPNGPNLLETQLELSSGKTIWTEITVNNVSDSDNSWVLVVIREITRRKQFEMELRRNRDFLDNIINSVPDPLSVMTGDRRLVVANDAFCQVYGLDREHLLGETLEIRSDIPEALPDQNRDGSILNHLPFGTTEQRYRNIEGTSRISSVRRSVFREPSSGESYIVATSRDITEDRRREQQLQLLASVFECASEGAVILRNDGVIAAVNSAFRKMAAVPDSVRIIGRRLSHVFPTDPTILETAIRSAVDGHPWSGKISFQDRTETRCSGWLTVSPSQPEHGRVTRLIAMITDITELENSQLEIRHQALHDPLTNLPNRTYFKELLDQRTRQCSQLSVCFLDLDDFKHVNDSAGHAAGDELLCQVCDRIISVVGPDAVLARHGGDEFALIISDRSHDEALQLIDRLSESFRDPFQVQDTSAVVGLSVGIAQYPRHAQDTESLLQTADIAMYAAKNSGKNRVRLFDTSLQDSVHLRHRVQSKLQAALEDGEISLHFQPKFAAQSRQLVGCESLVRWQNRNGEFMPPAQFIPIAEQTGLIGPLGDLVFHLAAKQAGAWSCYQLPHRIAVNISPHQLHHPGFLSQINRTLEESGAKPEWFELEITEHAMMDDVKHAICVIDQLADQGFRIAVDDFGTGYSSFSYLKDFVIHTLKIDISFVREVATNPYSEAIVRSIVSLGDGLGLTIVAEGVETQAQADRLTELGCDVLQGYYFAHPVPADQLQSLLDGTS